MISGQMPASTEVPSPVHEAPHEMETGKSARRAAIRHVVGQNSSGRRMGRPQDSLLCDMELPLRRTFYPLGFAVEILTNDSEVLEAADESFGHRRLCRGSAALEVRIGITGAGQAACPPEPTRREYDHLYSLIADVENQALLDLRSCTSFAWLTQAALRNRLYFRYNFLEKIVYLLLGASVVTDVHAACVSKKGRGILLCGDSGAGKSTLAYGCARAGWTFTSDDTSYLVNDCKWPRVIGHAQRLRFRPAARALFPELKDRQVTPRMEGKASIEISVAELPVLHTATEADVHAIVYLHRSSGAQGSLVRLPEKTATRRMSKELFSAGEIRAKHERQLEALYHIPTYELRYGELAEGITQLESLAQVG